MPVTNTVSNIKDLHQEKSVDFLNPGRKILVLETPKNWVLVKTFEDVYMILHTSELLVLEKSSSKST